MNRFRVSLTIALSTTILSAVLLGSVPADVCPFNKSNPTAVSLDKSSNAPFKTSIRPERSTPPNSEMIQCEKNPYTYTDTK
ncbi:MAG: hypothetical protein LH702_35300 [Phormidesmis sp. CAN_BIN44]|nr:hypothetical protein [Phormidesmis sp. CAN_BIN44]